MSPPSWASKGDCPFQLAFISIGFRKCCPRHLVSACTPGALPPHGRQRGLSVSVRLYQGIRTGFGACPFSVRGLAACIGEMSGPSFCPPPPPFPRCIFYAPEDASGRRGRCTEYALRPVVCRAFGFSGTRGKDGNVRLSVCRVMEQADPATMDAAVRALARQQEGGDGAASTSARDGDGPGAAVPVKHVLPPVFAEAASGVRGASPGDLGHALPINEATRLALERVMLRWQLSNSDAG